MHAPYRAALSPIQKLPTHAIDAIDGHELLVYLDATWTRGPEMGFVLTLAHELRHAWQYFNAPVVFHSQDAPGMGCSAATNAL